MKVSPLPSSYEASLNTASTQKTQPPPSPLSSSTSSKTCKEQSFSQASYYSVPWSGWCWLTMSLLLLTECKVKGFNGQRSVKGNESLTLRESNLFLLFLCLIKRALTNCKMVCNHLLTTCWALCQGSLSSTFPCEGLLRSWALGSSEVAHKELLLQLQRRVRNNWSGAHECQAAENQTALL